MIARLLALLFQFVIAVAASYTAAALAARFDAIPQSIVGGLKNAPLSAADVRELATVVGAFHLLAGLLAIAVLRRHPFSSFARFLRELYFVLAATSLAGCFMFMFSQVPFVPNVYAWLFALLPALYFVVGLLVLAIAARRRSGGESDTPGIGFIPAVRGFLISPWIVVTGLIIITPGVLAVAYKKNRDFADFVNYTRVSMHIETADAWALTEAFAGKRFEQPMYMEFEPLDNTRFYVLSRPGRLYRYTTEPEWSEELMLDFSGEVGSIDAELGAVGFALHPEFGRPGSPNAGYVYILYTSYRRNPTRQSFFLTRFDLSSGDLGQRHASRTVLIEQKRPATGMHNGGTVLFDKDGMLMFSVGDYQKNESQRIEERLAGGIFRIDVDRRGGQVSRPITNHIARGQSANYYIPRDNPWADREGALAEYWALGFRNPFRMWFDGETGRMWVGDVGWERYEEISRVAAGSNAQWYFREGPLETVYERPAEVIGKETPSFYGYDQTAMDRAVVGGFIYRGNLYPDLYGLYLFADNNSSVVRMLDPLHPGGEVTVLGRAGQLGQQGLTSLVSDNVGNVYATILGSKSENTGQILKLVRAEDAADLGGTATAAADQPVGEIVVQKFIGLCARCHGEDGRGLPEFDELGTGMDKRPDFTSAEWQASVTDQQIRDIVEKGGLAMQKSAYMPPWPGVFPGEEMDALVRYLRRLDD